MMKTILFTLQNYDFLEIFALKTGINYKIGKFFYEKRTCLKFFLYLCSLIIK